MHTYIHTYIHTYRSYIYIYIHTYIHTHMHMQREELTAHMKSDWHKHNLKLKSEGKPLLSKEEFVEYQLMAGN